jgi:hypothetical protein
MRNVYWQWKRELPLFYGAGVSKRFIAKGRNGYFGLVREQHEGNYSKLLPVVWLLLYL